jgi:hypothetical protein
MPATSRDPVDADTYRHALRKADPGEDRIDGGEPRLIRLYVRDVNATRDAADMPTNEFAVTHQFHGCRVARVCSAAQHLKTHEISCEVSR